MSSNRVHLAQLANLTNAEIEGLPLMQVAMLQEDVATMLREAKSYGDRINAALHARYSGTAAMARRAENKQTGTVTLDAEGMKIRCDLPAKVDWDQDQLAETVKVVQSWGEPVSDYVTVEYKVSEAAYKNWPLSIRSVFEPARTVGTGKPSYKVEMRGAA